MKKILILFISILLISCHEKKVIAIFGYIDDSVTKQPIKGAKVTVLCWYDAGWDKTDYQSIDVVTDSSGFFKASFDEGYKVTIASIAQGYDINMKEKVRETNENLKINILLRKNNLNQNISDINLTDYIIYNGTNWIYLIINRGWI